MAEPTSTAVPVVLLGGGFSIASLFIGLDQNAVVAAFAGSMMVTFMSRDVPVRIRLGLAACAWVFGYYAGVEVVRRKLWGFESASMPSYIAAFFCVAVFKTLLAVFNEDGKTWIRRKLGLTTEGPKND